MTIFLILGAAAGLYMLWLLFRLASLALPVYVAVGTGFALLRHDYSYPAAIFTAFGAGIATLLVGQVLIAFIRSPLLRLGIALLFAIPAAFAGYQAAHSLGSLATSNSSVLAVLGLIAAIATSVSAWRSVMGGSDHNSANSADDRSMSSNPHPARTIISE
jgi:hypothetical protein